MEQQQSLPESQLPEEVVLQKIFFIRGMKVMLDRDLAEMYGVDTKRLKEQVRRNIDRFPPDFMFELSKEELENWRSQNATSNSENMGLRHAPFAFSEHGVLMLSSVLNSPRAIAVNIRIMRIFTKMKEMILSNAELLLRVEYMHEQLQQHGESLEHVFDCLAKLTDQPQEPRKMIGFGR